MAFYRVSADDHMDGYQHVGVYDATGREDAIEMAIANTDFDAVDDDLVANEIFECSTEGYARHIAWTTPDDRSMAYVTDEAELGSYFDAIAEYERGEGFFREVGTNDDNEYLVPEGDELAEARKIFIANSIAAAKQLIEEDEEEDA